MDKKIKQGIKDWGYSLKSESPLTLKEVPYDKNDKTFKSTLVGLPAQMILNEIMSDIESEPVDMKDIKKMNDTDLLLVTAGVNYADEFDMSEFTTMNVKTFKEMAKKLKDHTDEIEWYFGSNEELCFDSGKDLLSNISVKQITEEESNTLDKLFGGEFGDAGVFEHIWELDMDNEEEEDEDEVEEEEEIDGLFDKSDLRGIEVLKSLGWTVSIKDESEEIIEYTHDNGEDSATTNAYFIHELLEHYKKPVMR